MTNLTEKMKMVIELGKNKDITLIAGINIINGHVYRIPYSTLQALEFRNYGKLILANHGGAGFKFF